MELRAGYKQTEVGVIPKDWDVLEIGEIGRVVRGGSPRPAGDPRFFNGSFIPWLTVAALTNIPESKLRITNTHTRLTSEGAKRSRVLEPETLIIANSGATLGVAKILGIKCCANDGIAAVVNRSKGQAAFLCHYINSRTTALRERVATGNGQPNLNTTLIGNITVPFPGETEQRAIAEALSDADGLIAGLERLIAKKRAIKQAAMQQLLTAKTRLPGFSGEWASVQFGNVVQVRNQKAGTLNNTRAERCVELELIGQDTGSISKLVDASNRNSIKYQFEVGDVLFGRLRPYLRKFWRADCDGVCSTEIWPLHSVNDRIDGSYLFQLVRTDLFIETASTAYGTHMPRADWNVIANFQMSLPIIPEEQQAIAAVLSDMDAEIAALEARRDKARRIKQGMMQELLTGRIRLV